MEDKPEAHIPFATGGIVKGPLNGVIGCMCGYAGRLIPPKYTPAQIKAISDSVNAKLPTTPFVLNFTAKPITGEFRLLPSEVEPYDERESNP